MQNQNFVDHFSGDIFSQHSNKRKPAETILLHLASQYFRIYFLCINGCVLSKNSWFMITYIEFEFSNRKPYTLILEMHFPNRRATALQKRLQVGCLDAIYMTKRHTKPAYFRCSKILFFAQISQIMPLNDYRLFIKQQSLTNFLRVNLLEDEYTRSRTRSTAD